MLIDRCLQMHTAVDDIDGLDDVENSILYYNQAVIYYHLRQYSEAISIGEKLYQFLEPFGMFQDANEKFLHSVEQQFLFYFKFYLHLD